MFGGTKYMIKDICDLYLLNQGSALGWIWPKNNNTCNGRWVTHYYQVPSKSLSSRRSRDEAKNVNNIKDDGHTTKWRTDDGGTDRRQRNGQKTDGRTDDRGTDMRRKNAWFKRSLSPSAFGSCALTIHSCTLHSIAHFHILLLTGSLDRWPLTYKDVCVYPLVMANMSDNEGGESHNHINFCLLWTWPLDHRPLTNKVKRVYYLVMVNIFDNRGGIFT